MILTTTGRTFVAGVFIGDGAECVDLHSLYQDEELAQRQADYLRNMPEMCGHDTSLYGSHGFVEVRVIEVHHLVGLEEAQK